MLSRADALRQTQGVAHKVIAVRVKIKSDSPVIVVRPPCIGDRLTPRRAHGKLIVEDAVYWSLLWFVRRTFLHLCCVVPCCELRRSARVIWSERRRSFSFACLMPPCLRFGVLCLLPPPPASS